MIETNDVFEITEPKIESHIRVSIHFCGIVRSAEAGRRM